MVKIFGSILKKNKVLFIMCSWFSCIFCTGVLEGVNGKWDDGIIEELLVIELGFCKIII